MKALCPMDMEELLLEMGEDSMMTRIKECFRKYTPMPVALHDASMNFYRQYLIVGGMPECVKQFSGINDYSSAYDKRHKTYCSGSWSVAQELIL